MSWAVTGSPSLTETAFAQAGNPGIIHDAEYYILDAQHGEQWKVEDKDLDPKLAELKKKFGTSPNIIHFMWDDQPCCRRPVTRPGSTAMAPRRH
jgi:hypothetical protein